MALNLKTFTTRTLTAAVFVAVLLSCICSNFVSFAALFFIVSIWGLYEFYLLAEKLGAKPYKINGIVAGILLFSYAIISNSNMALFLPIELLMATALVLVFCVFIAGLFDRKPNTVLNIAYTLSGLIYAVLPFTLLVGISCTDKSYTFNHITNTWYKDLAPYNSHYILGIILLIWASDSGAYLVGSLIGKHKLYERISPGKTWEGSVGAAILNAGCAYVISIWYPELALKHWIIISLLVSVFGTIGDLVESMLKRQAGVKDSGRIMPGHGGILDRFDSLLFVAPFVYFYLVLIH
jgi:phosphatidate cytidylyltransferase